MTRKNLETLVEMIHHVQIESTEEEEAILDLYYHLRLAVEREEEAEEEQKGEETEPRKKPKAKSEVPAEETKAEEAISLKKGALTKDEAALKKETHKKLQSGAYTVGELSEESGLSVGTILDMKNAEKVNIALWKRLAEAMDELDMNREEE